MSDTPKTDAVKFAICIFEFGKFKRYQPVTIAEHAESLERENQQLRAELESVGKKLGIERTYTEQFRDALKGCAEALGQTFNGLSLHEYLFAQFPSTQGHVPLRDFCIKQGNAMDNPIVQSALKPNANTQAS